MVRVRQFNLTVTDDILKYDLDRSITVKEEAMLGRFIDYSVYLKFREKIKMEGE